MERHATPRNGRWLGLSVAATLAFICAGVAPPGHIASAQDSGLRSPGSRTKGDKRATTPIPQKLLAEQTAHRAGGARVEWCQTQMKWEKKVGVRGSVAAACATQGTCDTPSVRDSWIPGGGGPITTLRIKFNVFCNSNGSNCASTQAGADAQLAQLNSDYLPSRIQWTGTTQFINNSTYRDFSDSEETAMKNAYADSPATQLNVYVVNVLGGYLGVGTFPWDPDATGNLGGIIIDDNWFGSGQKTLTHESGHNVGLWHTHHGVSEVSQCSACWERADGQNGDTTGDFASDTAPTPTNYNCSDPSGNDPCSGVSWAPTDPQNYMGYAPDSCYTEFSSQQWGRQHCWTNDQLAGWIEAPCNTDPECDDGRFCNGVETCVGGSCQAGTSPCGGGACDEATDTCATLAYEWNLDTDPGWTMQGQWAHGQPNGGGGQYGGPDPTSGATGANVLGYNLNGDYANNLSETHLTSTAIDCSSLTGVTLQFQRWLGVEQPAYDHAYVRVSNNGSSWTTIWQNTGQVADSAWSLQEYDISAVADNQATVYLRWTMGTTDSSWQFCGWNIDDIQLYAVGGGCQSNPDCDDGVFCNGAETCNAGTCQAGTAPTCDDGVACTDDSCNTGTDSCDNVANDGNCDDGVACNGTETCHATNDCQAGTAVNCDDGVACTTDSCNEPSGTCSNVTNDAACDDGVFCNGSETCDAVNDCQSGTPPACDDGVTCTTDSCNTGTDSCDNVTNDAACDDGLACNGAETCDAVNDCQGGTAVNCDDGVACTTDACNEPGGTCSNTPSDAACDDGQACNGTETCDAVNDCQAGTAVNCDDGVACTTDACNEPGGTCSNAPSDAACDDGLACNGAETCDAVNDCQAGTAVNCDDGVACTTDACNEPGGTCSNTPDDAACDDGAFCNGAETCDAALDCQAGTDPCPGQSCDEAGNACVQCQVDGDCDDGFACNGLETCAAGACQAGTAVNCDDGVACTIDSCSEPSGTCSNVTSDAACDDGLACNGAETCDAVFDCQAGTAVNCNDGVACTDDACNEPSGTCSNVANDANCDDGTFCNGAETCDSANDCQAGTAVNCDDGVVCTLDSCNEAAQSCDNVPDNAGCDDGVYCNGTETCDAVNDCQAGTAVNCNDGVGCTDDSCNEATQSCDNIANDGNCPDDGLFCTGTEFCDPAADCSSTGDPCLAGETCNEGTNACDTGPPPGEGYILSRNADFSTDDRNFFRNETIYMKVWTDQVDFNDIRKAEWELRDTGGQKVKQALTNHFDGTYTASFDLAGLPSTDTNWTWKGKVEDNSRTKYRPTDAITVLDAPACSIDSDCDDGDACTTDVCSGGSCSNTPIDCNDGSACTTDYCSGGVCFNDPISCDDGNACTTDTCDPGAGCSNTPINCDDGDPCTSDSCSGGVCFNDPAPTCCGDTFCDPGEDSCNCPADCGAPPATETNCTDGNDEDCDGLTDCADADCSADPACSTPTGEGYILSRNPDYSTDDRTFNRSDTLYMKMWTDVVDFNDINRARWELKDPQKNKVRQPFTNHFDGTYTATFDLVNLPSNATDWTWKGEVKDNAGNRYKPSDAITVLP